MAKTMPTAPSEQQPADATRTTGKGRATPTRREREAERKRPLVPTDRRQANREARAKMQSARDRARVGMANGDERYLPARDKGPQKRFVRDYVDARFSAGELMIPLMFLVILLSIVQMPALQTIGMIALWIFFIIVVADSLMLGFLVRRKLAAKFGADRVERGVRWYAAMRALQLRRMRLPKPQVKRGAYPA